MIPERDSAIRGVWTFLLIAFGLGWAAQIIVARMLLTVDGTMAALGGGIFIAAVALMWPPAVGAFVARRWVEKSGFDDAGLRRPRTRAVLIAWFGPPALVMIALLLSLPVYPFDAGFQALAESAEQAGQPLPVAPGILVLVQIAFAL